MNYRKNCQKINFKPFYTHKGFDSQNFPYFKKYLLGRSLIVLKHFSIFMPPNARTREWNIFGWRKKVQSSGVPIRLLANKKSLCAILKNIKDNLVPTFERFLMTSSSARSILVNFSLKKNLTLNGCKPIRVLTCTKSSYSDERLPLGYLLPDFQQI